MLIGNRIKELRKKLYLTQTEFADKLNLKQATIGMYENGIRNVNERSINQICRTFNVNEDWLRYGTGEMFIKNDTMTLDEFAKKNNLSEDEYDIIRLYMSIDPEIRKAAIKSLKSIFLKNDKTEKTNLKLVARGGTSNSKVDLNELHEAIKEDSKNNENNNNDLY